MPKGLSTPLGAAREIQEGIAVDPLLVGCGVKPHDFDFSFKSNQAELTAHACWQSLKTWHLSQHR
ncbi:MAG: hypothetical protein COW15_07915 [Shewanella sp. CG12_big_fil_rev_8_21_14_0_65_47_15]|nr:MAG: hypothetical protein COW15_07915 [Shewanella sp. CG12_big_fil_rev_8_21_14_0_65_47_15]